MRKLFDDKQYAEKAAQANAEQKLLIVVERTIEYDVDVPEWNKKTIEVQKYDEEGNPMYDEDGNPIMEEIEVDDYDNPIMVEETIIDPETGKEITVLVQKTHKEHRIEHVLDLEIIDEPIEVLKARKSKEALDKANEYIATKAEFEFEEGKHIEATTDNVAKLTSYLLAVQQGLYKEIVWVTKEDEVVMLDAEKITNILQGIAAVQSDIWVIDYTGFITRINEAETAGEVKNIVIDYDNANFLAEEIDMEDIPVQED